MKRILKTIGTVGVCLALVNGCGSEDPEPNSETNQSTSNNSNNENNENNSNTENNSIENNSNNENNVSTNNSNNALNNTNGQTGPQMLEIFDTAFGETGCTAGYCHGGAVDGLVLMNSETARENLVDVVSIRPECGLTKLVVPGDPDSSLLWMRVRPAALDAGEPCAAKMPKNSDGLDEATAELIYDWILGGAL